MARLDKTNSTLLLKQPNSLDVDTEDLRKTKSAENIFCPRIIIDQVCSQQFTKQVSTKYFLYLTDLLQNY